MTLRMYRIMLGALFGVGALSAGNYFLNWGFFGSAAKLVMSGAVFVMILLMAFMPAKVNQEMQAEHEDRLRRDREWERTRDKSNDEGDNATLRKDVGLPPNTSLERTRER